MRRSYEQLSLEDRCEIARLSANGNSVRQIAAALDRSPSTISRELKRNRGRQIGYRPSYAEQQTRARRWKGSRLERDESLRATVIERLASGWSPEQIAGRLAREQGRKVISYESIYRFIYAQLARTKDYRWRRYLPRGKSKRGCRGRKGGGSQNFIEGRISLAERPPDAADRETPGHWEADLMMFSKYGQAILTVHERKSRLLLAIRLASKAARGVARHLVRLFAALPEALRQTVTFDNGTEFACHLALHGLAIETFFCDPYAPWQKGGIENAIGRMRRFLPRKTDLATLPASRFRRLVAAYNNTPRKCLDFSTPAESFAQLLHFECESTSRRSPGRRKSGLIPSRRVADSRLGFPNQMRTDSSWQTEEVCHGSGDCGSWRFSKRARSVGLQSGRGMSVRRVGCWRSLRCLMVPRGQRRPRLAGWTARRFETG
jgi:IS30 family transposase